MAGKAIVFTLLVSLIGTLPAIAQQTPCLGCAISRAESAAQVRANQQAVSDALQAALNSRLQAQANALQTQALLRTLQQNAQLQAGQAELQQLEALEQLELMQIEQRPPAASKTSPAPPRHAEPSPKPGR